MNYANMKYENNKENAILFLQKILNAVSENTVLISGVFDNNTKNAVLSFKETHGLEGNCSVDKMTFDTIFSEFELLHQTNCEKEFFGQIEFLPNIYSHKMQIINMMLSNVLSYYGIHTDIRELPYYYDETDNALEVFCKICRLDRKSISESALLCRLALENKTIEKLKDKFE